jgi:hypothetical protein
MRSLIFLLLGIVVHILGQDIDAKLVALQAKIDYLANRLLDLETAGVHLYKDRSSCPEGFYPMENSDGRFLLLQGSERGAVSGHTFKDEKVLTLPCSKQIQVSESGWNSVCSGSGDGTPVAIDLEKLIPYVKLLGCVKSQGPNPVI